MGVGADVGFTVGWGGIVGAAVGVGADVGFTVGWGGIVGAAVGVGADWLLERISYLNGQVVASHMMNAILFYTLRTGAPVESIYRNIQSFSEFLPRI